MYMEKKSIFISLPICCFQKTAALCGFSQIIDYQQICASVQSFISSFIKKLFFFLSSHNESYRTIIFMQPTSCVTNLKGLRDLEFVYINVTIGICL